VEDEKLKEVWRLPMMGVHNSHNQKRSGKKKSRKYEEGTARPKSA
jgi:hypothetical protein